MTGKPRIKLTGNDTADGRHTVTYQLAHFPANTRVPVTIEYANGARVLDYAWTDDHGNSGATIIKPPATNPARHLTATHGATTAKATVPNTANPPTDQTITVHCDRIQADGGHYDVTIHIDGLTPGSEAVLSVHMNNGPAYALPLPVNDNGHAKYLRVGLHPESGGTVQVQDGATGVVSDPVPLLGTTA